MDPLLNQPKTWEFLYTIKAVSSIVLQVQENIPYVTVLCVVNYLMPPIHKILSGSWEHVLARCLITNTTDYGNDVLVRYTNISINIYMKHVYIDWYTSIFGEQNELNTAYGKLRDLWTRGILEY